MIRFESVYKSYSPHNWALKNVSLSINKGDFAFVTGKSGSGKTTLLGLMACFDRPSSGKITVKDTDISSLPEGKIPYFRREIGFVFQDFKLINYRNIFENVSIPLKIRHFSQKKIHNLVNTVLDDLGLLERKYSHVDSLSGGEKQKVAIARALVNKPDLIIADEPTGSLDFQSSQDILNILKRVNKKSVTVIVATHDISIVKQTEGINFQLDQGTLKSKT